MCYILLIVLLIADQRVFKLAANDQLQLECNQVQLIEAITKENCFAFAKLISSANAISYDHINSKCSIQNCNQTRNFPTKPIVPSNISIYFEAGLYPKSKSYILMISISNGFSIYCSHFFGLYFINIICLPLLCIQN